MLKIWFNRELQSQQTLIARKRVAKGLWQKHIEQSELPVNKILSKLELLLKFLGSSIPANYLGDAHQYAKWVKQNFVSAIENHDYACFAKLFNSLSLDALNLINIGEGLELQIPEHKLPSISVKSVRLLQEYMDDAGYSAAVSIMNADGSSYTFASKGIDPKTPFAMYSVGKIFTGILMLIAIQKGIFSEDDLEKPIQLASSVWETLSKEVQQRLSEVTLKQIMLHKSGLGDYINKYCNAIRDAISGNHPIPNIRTCHDLLTYADTDVGSPCYSNLGILLIGLAIEHAFYLKTGQEKPYEEILQDFIINPVEMTVFSTHRPNNGRYDAENAVVNYIVASPAGGYWTTVEDLQKFGNWVILLCRSDPEFLRLLETYGGEFYSHAKREIIHSGRMPSASALLISSLESGTTVAILSDQRDIAPKLSMTIVEQSVLDNIQCMRSSASTYSRFFKAAVKAFVIEHRHDNAELQHEYDKQFGLILKK